MFASHIRVQSGQQVTCRSNIANKSNNQIQTNLQSSSSSGSVAFEPNDGVEQNEVSRRDDGREDDGEGLWPTRLKKVLEKFGPIGNRDMIRHFQLRKINQQL